MTTSWTRAGSGPLSLSVTVMVNDLVSLRFGELLSVTHTVTRNVPASVGVQVNTPVVGSIQAPAGASAPRLNVTPGSSGSVALAVKVIRLPTCTAWLSIRASTGA